MSLVVTTSTGGHCGRSHQAKEGGLKDLVGLRKQLAHKNKSSVVAKAKTWELEQFREAMERDFWLALWKFWKTIQ